MTTRMGRPRKPASERGMRFTVYLASSIYRLLNIYRRKHKLSKSKVVNQALSEMLNEPEEMI